MRGTNDWMPWTTPITLTPCTQRQSLTVVSQISDDGAPTPALLHRRWHAPNVSNVAAASASTDSGSVTSVTTHEHLTAERSELVAGAVERRRFDVGETTFMPSRDERARERQPDARCAAGDDRDLSFAYLHRSPPVCK